MKDIKFKRAGKWAEMDPRAPQFTVEAGGIQPVSDNLADFIVESSLGEIVVSEKEKELARVAFLQGVADKAAAEVKNASGKDKEKAQKTQLEADKALADALAGE